MTDPQPKGPTATELHERTLAWAEEKQRRMLALHNERFPRLGSLTSSSESACDHEYVLYRLGGGETIHRCKWCKEYL